MERGRSAHPWIARYCIRTLQLQPSLPARIAIRWAVAAYPYCADLEPERAAEIFVDSRRARAAQALQRFAADDTDHGAPAPHPRNGAGQAAHG
jgi:hypothetical protein